MVWLRDRNILLPNFLVTKMRVTLDVKMIICIIRQARRWCSFAQVFFTLRPIITPTAKMSVIVSDRNAIARILLRLLDDVSFGLSKCSLSNVKNVSAVSQHHLTNVPARSQQGLSKISAASQQRHSSVSLNSLLSPFEFSRLSCKEPF